MTRAVGYSGLGQHGRFGNCLHIIASTVGIARKRRVPVALAPSDWPYRPFLSIPDEWWDDNQKGVAPATAFARQLSKRARPYLQDLSLWDHCADEVRAAFSLSPMAREIVDHEWQCWFSRLPKPVCGVHVRRGDTVTRNPANTINPLPADYFLRGIEATGASSAVVFTDDPEWCQTHLGGKVDLIYEGTPGPEDYEADYLTRVRTDWVDWALMSWTDAQVISNSSFSWWAAFLSTPDPEEWNVIVPSRWYGPKLQRDFDVSLILPKEWKRIEVVE